MQNFSYVTILQLFTLLAPLITYPYLVRVLGQNLYGIVLTAQMLASYVSMVIDFGSNEVCAKHVSIYRDNKSKLSEILSAVLCTRFILWVASFFVYSVVVILVPSYREYALLFFISYFLSIQEFLFPQFFFQGIEQMKFTTYITIIIRLFFICLVFFIVKDESDVLMVPILYSVGYFLGGLASLFIIRNKMDVHFQRPTFEQMKFYVKDSSAIFATNMICTIKDKFNYLLVGLFSGMSNVVVYDLGLKINGFIEKPAGIVRVVLFPRMAKSRNVETLKKTIYITVIFVSLMVLIVNIFLPWIVEFFIKDKDIDLLPLRIFTIAPILLSASVLIASNYLVAFGHNKYVLYSIIVTTSVYLLSLAYLFFTHKMNGLYSFISLSLISYATELIYRLFVLKKLTRK